MEVGTLDAYSKEAAISILQKYDVFVTFLEEQKKKTAFYNKIVFQPKVTKKELTMFFRQLSVLLDSQVSVVQSLTSLAQETKRKSFKKIILDLAKLVEEGVSFSQALLAYPDVFSNFHVNLVRSGEASGKIALALHSISMHLERENDIATQVKQALIYPLFLMCILFLVVGVIVTQIVPKIEDLIKETGGKPSLFTSVMLSFYNFLGSYWWFLVLTLILLVVSIVMYLKTKEGKREYDEISLRIPFFGDILKKVFLIRFCSNVSTLLIAGITINKTLEITEDTVDNNSYKIVIGDIGKKVSEGEKLSLAMARYPKYFPLFVLQITKVGEATGKLDKTLNDVVEFYEKDIKRSIDLFSRLLEPIMIIIMGGVVALLAGSVLSSIYGTIGSI